MSEKPDTIRSYQRVFRPERRIYSIDGRPLPVPGGVPLRWLAYATGAVIANLLIASGSTTISILIAAAAAVVGFFALVFARESLQSNLREVVRMLSPTFAVSLARQVFAEETLRFTLQSRIGAWTRSPLMGTLVAGIVWAALHVPNAYRGEPAMAAAGVVVMLPIALLWGTLTLRTGGIWAACLAHMLNVFGLQNL